MFFIIQKPPTPFEFLIDRAIRILPMYFIMSFIVMMYWGHSPQNFFKSIIFIPSDGLPSTRYPILPQGWTLNIEVYFYIFITALLITKTSRAMILMLSIASSSLFMIYYFNQSMILVFSGFSFYFEFLFGSLICRLMLLNKLPNFNTSIILIAIGVMILAAFPQFADTPFRCILWGGPASLIVCGMVALEKIDRFPRFIFVKIFGDASYSIYLTHFIIIERLRDTRLAAYPMWAQLLLKTTICIAVGVAAYHLLEKPLHGFLSRYQKRKSSRYSDYTAGTASS